MARSKTIKAPDSIPVGVLKQQYEDNSEDKMDDAAEGSLRCSHSDISSPSISKAVDAEREDIDFDLIRAVKEDLKQNIHQRRQEKGLGQIAYDKNFPRSYQLTATEQKKRQLRKERNRIAAAKCREKKRHQTIQLMRDSERLDKRNRYLQEQAEQLKTEKAYLQQLLQEHLAVCPKGSSGYRR